MRNRLQTSNAPFNGDKRTTHDFEVHYREFLAIVFQKNKGQKDLEMMRTGDKKKSLKCQMKVQK